MRKFHLVFVCLLLLFSTFLSAQPNRKGIEWMLREKIKIDPAKAILFAETPDNPNIKSGASVLKHSDMPVAAGSPIDAEVHAAVNPTDTQNLAVAMIRQTVSTISMPIYYTKNFGGSWTKSSFNPMPAVPGAIAMGGGDPVLVYDPDGRAYYSWLELHIRNMSTDTIYWGLYWAYSDDKGVNWIRPSKSAVSFARVVASTFTSDRPVTDKQWMTVDKSSSSYRGNLYMSYVEIDISTGSYTIMVHTKPADSTAFNPLPVAISDASFTLCQFASLDVDYQGKVHVTFFGTKDDANYHLYHAVSSDGGLTFSQPQVVAKVQLPRFSAGQLNDSVPGISSDRLYPACYMASNPLSQHIYLTWTANGVTQKEQQGLDIYFCSSADGGLTWSTPKVVNDNVDTFGSHQYYSSISCGTDGNVLLGWYDRRDDTANIKAHYYFSESFDHGLTFSPGWQVTTLGTDFSKTGLSNDNFGIGEYTQILGLKDYIIPVWTDGRTNNGDLNIYAAFINRKTMGLEQITGVNAILGVSAIYPNPSAGDVTVDFTLTGPTDVLITLFDLSGQKVTARNLGKLNAGFHSATFTPGDLPAGMYYLSVTAGTDHFSKKLVIIK